MFTPERNYTHTGTRASPVIAVRFGLTSDETWLMPSPDASDDSRVYDAANGGILCDDVADNAREGVHHDKDQVAPEKLVQRDAAVVFSCECGLHVFYRPRHRPSPTTPPLDRRVLDLGRYHGCIQYRRDGVGLSAVNDACLIKSSIMVLLRQYFGDHPDYGQLVELFHEAALRTELGQLADMTTSNKCSLAEMTMERYEFTAENKAAFYSFYLPVALALRYLQCATGQNMEIAREVLLGMGWYFQVQDDYLDLRAEGYAQPLLRKAGHWERSQGEGCLLSGRYEGAFMDFEMTELDNLEKRIDQIGGEHGPVKDIVRSVLEKISRRNK
ncbi:Farnesyl pyrophosphate synthase [Penicillium mononematosum]|uniref:Farnesyl pyrophosphate synthase n=1 Tax=Penicillium mononematosum TaxID=268346 RepID=UPI002546B0E9|nr:Farnesyl pyrophosphate synthase [Penicillium mononematosum]KAJ6188482.1 Farnesyl pyrophosphate synthase [Penicillium mononematosum]